MEGFLKKAKDLLTPALVVHTPIVAERAEGLYVEGTDGRRYMDFSSGLAVTNTGHNHPRVVRAIREQAEALIHSGCIFHYRPLLDLCERLKEITPPGIEMFFFSNAGAEVVEGAIKLARYATKRQGIIAFTGAFHGRTMGAASLTTSSIRYRRRYPPFLPSVYHSPYPYCYRCYFGQAPDTCGMECYLHIERMLKHIIPPEEVAAIIMEPILGEGGYVVPPKGFLKNLRDLCSRWGILLVLDEVQSGMGRTGKWFACEHFDIVPDIMTIAKGIASGMPLSALAGRREIMERWDPGAHGTTFGGNPISCAAAIATIDVIREEGLLERAERVGSFALERLEGMKRTHPSIGDVRGRGLMIGIEFVKGKKEPDPERLKRIINRCLERGLILIECGVNKNIIRLAPPLIIGEEEMAKALSILEEAIKEG